MGHAGSRATTTPSDPVVPGDTSYASCLFPTPQARQAHSRADAVRGRHHGQALRGAHAVRHRAVVRRQYGTHAAHLRAVARVRPHGGPADVCGRQGHTHGERQPGAGPGPGGAAVDRAGHGGRLLGGAAELPPGQELPAHAGAHLRAAAGGGQGAPQLPAVAHVLPLAHLPHLHPGERSQDDQRGAQGAARRPAADLHVGPHLRARLFHGLRQGRRVPQHAVRPGLLPLHSAGGSAGFAACWRGDWSRLRQGGWW